MQTNGAGRLHAQKAFFGEQNEQRSNETRSHPELKSRQVERRGATASRRLHIHRHGRLGQGAGRRLSRLLRVDERPYASISVRVMNRTYDGFAAVCARRSIAEAQAFANE